MRFYLVSKLLKASDGRHLEQFKLKDILKCNIKKDPPAYFKAVNLISIQKRII